MIYRLDEFTESEINLITSAPYDDSWVVFILTDSKEYNMFVGGINDCAYTVKFSRYANEDWRLALCDFIEYNENNNKNIILVLKSEELEEAKNAYIGHSFKQRFLRGKEPKILVHSTTLESYKQIQKDGMLKCFNKLNLQGEPIGIKLGDPKDFSDYIMFYDGGTTGEIVVNSKQKGRIVMDINGEYVPGARLYFDAAKIAADGILIRDGCHLKVKSELPLTPYLIFTATAESVGLDKETSTPKEFSEKADKAFKTIFKKDKITLRSLEDNDDALLLKWLTTPEVLEYYEGRDKCFDLQVIHKKFYNDNEAVTRCIIEYCDDAIGYLQFYPFDEFEYGIEP